MGEMNELTVIKTVNPRRRKVKLGGLKYMSQTNSQISTVNGESKKFSDTKRTETFNGDVTHQEVNKNDCPSRKNEMVFEKSQVESTGEYSCVSYGSVSVIGGRREMEDAVSVELGFASKGEEKYDFFGVYDGHGGAKVAEACRERFHRVLEEEMVVEEGMLEWERVMEESFKRMDEEVMKDRMMGSTAVVAVVGKKEVVVANCGDSRAILSRGGVVVPLSVDHKADRPDELERVESAGGRVINWNGHRVLGVLSTSRSIGDQYLKPFVISKPEVTVSKRSNKDEFLILASDGLWDMISNEFACQVVRRCLSGRMRRKSQEVVVSESRAAEAAIVLTELAMGRGNRDNISVIVVDLKTPRTN